VHARVPAAASPSPPPSTPRGPWLAATPDMRKVAGMRRNEHLSRLLFTAARDVTSEAELRRHANECGKIERKERWIGGEPPPSIYLDLRMLIIDWRLFTLASRFPDRVVN